MKNLASILLASALTAPSSAGEDITSTYKFKLTLEGKVKTVFAQVEPVEHMATRTTILYSIKRSGNELELICDSMELQVSENGKETLDTRLSRKGIFSRERKNKQDVSIDQTGPTQRRFLEDSFGVPLCKVTVDKEGAELKRVVVAGAGAKATVENGMITNMRMFHPRFAATANQWDAEREVVVGGIASARGNLVYEKLPAESKPDRVKLKVSGKLTLHAFDKGPMSLRNMVYEVSGHQIYGTASREWDSGEWDVKVTYEIFLARVKQAFSSGTMKLKLERLDNKEVEGKPDP